MTGRDDSGLAPPPLKPGDLVRFVSPASSPAREDVCRRARILERWGLKVDFGAHAFDERGYLAGRDDDRLDDLNTALRDPAVRAVFATRGGKGSYRIADRLDFDAARRDPKFVVGFSDITILHLSLWKHSRLIGIHGAHFGVNTQSGADTDESLRRVLMDPNDIALHARHGDPTAAFTTDGQATGILLGGNLEMIATAAGWALPDLTGTILLIEAVDMQRGQVDRLWTMLAKSGCLDGVAGLAFGQFHKFRTEGAWTVFDYLKEHLDRFGVPILGGLPLGHGDRTSAIPVGASAHLDATAGTLTVEWPAGGRRRPPAPRTSPSVRHLVLPGNQGRA